MWVGLGLHSGRGFKWWVWPWVNEIRHMSYAYFPLSVHWSMRSDMCPIYIITIFHSTSWTEHNVLDSFLEDSSTSLYLIPWRPTASASSIDSLEKACGPSHYRQRHVLLGTPILALFWGLNACSTPTWRPEFYLMPGVLGANMSYGCAGGMEASQHFQIQHESMTKFWR